MSWKENLQLRDLEEAQRLEVTCCQCGYTYYESASELLKNPELQYAYLDEVETHLRCTQRGCNNSVRIALTSDGVTEGFMGGLA